MKTIIPLKDKVLGRMVDTVGGIKKTVGGLITVEHDMTESAIRPRWFEITHVGPDQLDVNVGQYVLVPHGRWSRGIDIEHTHQVSDYIFQIDHHDILGVQDVNPLSQE
jgi:co-chaperonin GroES (HSP10)